MMSFLAKDNSYTNVRGITVYLKDPIKIGERKDGCTHHFGLVEVETLLSFGCLKMCTYLHAVCEWHNHETKIVNKLLIKRSEAVKALNIINACWYWPTIDSFNLYGIYLNAL